METRILLWGTDPSLLDTRSEVLRRCGWNISSGLASSLANSAPCVGPVDIVVLCYTLNPFEQVGILKAVRAKRPDVLSLAVIAFDGSPAFGTPTATVHVRQGPKGLIDAVADLLSRRSMDSLGDSSSI